MKILFLAANPQSTERLNLEKEAREIEEALQISKLSQEFELIQKWEVRPRDFRRALLKFNPNIVHFSGHGKGKAGLVISDAAGKEKAVTGEALAGLFANFPSIKCVLLNACYAEFQAKAIVKHVDYVIGMRDTVFDQAAIAFSIGFYDSLGYGKNIEEAFKLGSNAILWEYANYSGKTRQMIPVDLVQAESLESLPEHLKPILLKKAAMSTQQTVTQPIKNNPVAVNHNPQQKYRERIQQYLADRKLTPIEKFQLATLAKELGISESVANEILQAELGQIEQAKTNYQNVLRQTIEQGYYPFNRQIEQQLKDLQASLNLFDSEVAEISRAILEEAEIEHKKTFFTFEVVTVNAQGQEIQRKTKRTEYYVEELSNSVTLEMVVIPSGSFWMGTRNEEIEWLCKTYDSDWYKNEAPQHQVNVASFLMGRYPVTQAQWREVAGWEQVARELNPDPSKFKEDYEGIERWTRPVEQVSWYDAQEFCARLSKRTNQQYRLPTEAEWEYAARAGTKTPFHFGETISTDLANYRGTDWEINGKVYPGNYDQGSKGIFREQTTPIGYFKVANGFGLSDIHGNVWEWCEDDWHSNYKNSPTDESAWLSSKSNTKVVRSGSWLDVPVNCRSAARVNYNPELDYDDIGFRVVCMVPRTP
ncbi:hypothetical protein Xen7305DRAFT_00007970 [Xenococcus sp. PCC 7305]|uniref:SUMF1/EgtB/PvdO family nonheme iron enzyme n=1 Tax=Xenococcus sp. PCC 7305 TaxID=102125 RepID=UPI0002ACB8DD|nr:SUMF1/EgtB/PvdO family nonheme iron enzyme [Xenococcus sp. PCC 7305]ELS01096.1 hypothetical protein Xen7305DRAFT_00007970 [Xenococcus sp. PCC 7305]